MLISTIYLVSIVITILLAFIALFQDTKSPVNRSFFILNIGIVVWMVSMYAGYIFVNTLEVSVFFIRLASGVGLFVVLSLAHFFFHFPQKSKKNYKNILNAFLILDVFVFLVATFTSLVQESMVIENGEIVGDLIGPLYPIYGLIVLFHILLSLLFVIPKIVNSRGIERRKVIVAFSGFILSIIFVNITNTILPLFGIFFFQKESISFSLFMIFAAFYSMQKHRFFNFSFTVLNTFRRVCIYAVFSIVVFFSYTGFSHFIDDSYILISILLSAFLGTISYVMLNKSFPQLISKSHAEFINALIELKTGIFNTDSLEDLLKSLEKAFVVDLGINKLELLIVRSKNEQMGIPIYLRNEFTKEIENKHLNEIVADEIKYLQLPIKKRKLLTSAMKEMQAKLCFPLYVENKIIGLLILGEKVSGHQFTKEEIEEILKLKQMLAIPLMNSLLKTNLREENNLMKKIIKEKTNELQQRFEDIKVLLKQQSDFIAVTAHEFRTPLSIAKFQVEDIISNPVNSTKPNNDIVIVEKALDDLINLTQALFDVQQYDLEKVKTVKKSTDIVKFLEDISTYYRSILLQKGIEISFKNNNISECILNIDSHKIKQVISNLIDNASKYSTKKIGIELSENKEKLGIIIKIIDHGKGISDDNKKRIFQKFQTEKVSMGMGIGLGLYLCEKILELHDGKIWVEDTPGGGAMFLIYLPH